MKPLQTEQLNITPKIARELINTDSALRDAGKNATRQRTMTGAKVSQYREDYRAGKWKRNHQGILLTTEGEILDGQHRLEAIAGLDGGSFATMVTKCAPEDANEIMLTIDGGKPRDVSQQLWLSMGIENSKPIVSAIRAEAILVAGVYKHGGLSSAQIVQAIDFHKHAVETIVAILLSGQSQRIHSALAGPLALYATFAKAKAVEFAEGFISGVGLGATSPILWLKRGFEKRTKSKVHWHQTGRLAIMTANALLAYHNNKRMDDIPSLTDEAGRVWLIENARPVAEFLESLIAATVQTQAQIRNEARKGKRRRRRIVVEED